ncbi:hypothetical protein WM14_27455 [Burkholderia ubonensis]|nr:hypothetical protein WM14_27455 [Burkholderia ubonensis]
MAKRLAVEGMTTLGVRVAQCTGNGGGGGWWRAVTRIGASRAGVLVARLRRPADMLGVAVDVDTVDPLVTPSPVVEPVRGLLGPLERLAVQLPLSGARGTNRAPALPYVRVLHDLDAIRASLIRLARPSPGATQRAKWAETFEPAQVAKSAAA